jgi:TolA-binding protein
MSQKPILDLVKELQARIRTTEYQPLRKDMREYFDRQVDELEKKKPDEFTIFDALKLGALKTLAHDKSKGGEVWDHMLIAVTTAVSCKLELPPPEAITQAIGAGPSLLNLENADLKARLDQLMETMNKLNQEVESLNQENQKLIEENKKLNQTEDRLIREAADMKQELDDEKLKHAQAREALSAVENKLLDLQTRPDNAQPGPVADTEEIVRLKAELALLQNQLVELPKLRATAEWAQKAVAKFEAAKPTDHLDPDTQNRLTGIIQTARDYPDAKVKEYLWDLLLCEIGDIGGK